MKQFLIFLSIICLMPTFVQAEEILALTEEWPPYTYTEDGKIMGVGTDIVQATLDKADIKASFKLYPWARSYKLASEGENILIYTIMKTAEREELFKWIGPILPPAEIFMFKLKTRDDIVIETLEDAKQYKIGVARNDSYHHLLLEKGFEDGKDLLVTSGEDISAKNLLKGRVDLILGVELPITVRMQALGSSFDELEKVLLFKKMETGLYMAFGQNTSDEVVERVRAAFEQVKAEGIIEASIEKYIQKFK